MAPEGAPDQHERARAFLHAAKPVGKISVRNAALRRRASLDPVSRAPADDAGSRRCPLMDVSCAFPTTLDSPQHAAVAEDLGYKHAWFYDAPPTTPDVWMVLGMAAQVTSRIGLGPGVLNPMLRHPMTNAAGAAGLSALAPGRVAVGFGTGFAPRVLGQRQAPWSYVEKYVKAFRGLLQGKAVEW